jgi:hypothetical protein
MFRRVLRPLVLLSLAALAGACETSKSANPLSPSVAGPIPGVEITAPKPLEPVADSELPNDKQPLTLLIENASTTGQRPLKLTIEVAADSGFTTKVFSRAGVDLGPNGRTALQMPDKLASDRTYFWHVKAEDGANQGAWSTVSKFSIFTPAVLQAPTPISPVGGTKVSDQSPEFRVKNAARSGPVGAITYLVEISRNDSFTAMVATFSGADTGPGGESHINSASDLPASMTLFWRVRAWDGTLNGPWSSTQYFVTPAGVVVPPPGGGDGGGGGGGGGNGGSCASNNGDFIISCISAKYVSYRRAGVSSAQRRSNMEFLRNRVIEAGICGGLRLGWNLKRGGPDISVDFITELSGGQTIGYDIARDYDNTSKVLQLTWASDGPGSHYKEYTPRPTCN